MFPGWQERDPCGEQVANAPDASVPLTPASQARALATVAGWAPWISGQTVPLIWEPMPDEDDACLTR